MPKGRAGRILVRVTDRAAQRPRGPVPVVEIELDTRCPRCRRGRRVRVRLVTWREDGHKIEVHRWDKTCSHADLYRDVLAEAGRATDTNRYT